MTVHKFKRSTKTEIAMTLFTDKSAATQKLNSLSFMLHKLKCYYLPVRPVFAEEAKNAQRLLPWICVAVVMEIFIL